MPDTIEAWRVQAFSDNVQHLSQQKVSYLENWARKAVNLKGKVKFFDRLSPAEMQRQTIRNGDTQWVNQEHSRRAAFKQNYVWARPIDEEDQLETIDDITNEIATAASYAVGRRLDQTWIDAIGGSASSLEDGSGSVALPAAQLETTATNNTLAKIAASMKILNKNAVVIVPQDVVYVLSPDALQHLILLTTFTSRDFNPAMALMTGQISTYLGMTWVMSILLPILSGTVRATYLAHRNCVGFAEWVRVSASIDKRPDKNNLTQVLVKTMHAAVRIEDGLCVQNQVTE